MDRNRENVPSDLQGKQVLPGRQAVAGADGRRDARFRKGQPYIWALLCALGGVFILLGIARGEFLTVLRKAAAICLECIGIG